MIVCDNTEKMYMLDDHGRKVLHFVPTQNYDNNAQGMSEDEWAKENSITFYMDEPELWSDELLTYVESMIFHRRDSLEKDVAREYDVAILKARKNPHAENL